MEQNLLEFNQMYFLDENKICKKTKLAFIPGKHYISIYEDELSPTGVVFQFIKANAKTIKKSENPFTSGAMDLVYLGVNEPSFVFLRTDVATSALQTLDSGNKLVS